MKVMIGIDPHKATHTAVAIDNNEVMLDELRVQLRYPCAGREYYDRRCAEGKNSKEAIRALKRHISNSIYRALIADARRAAD